MTRTWTSVAGAIAVGLAGCAPSIRGPKVDQPGKLPAPAPSAADVAYDSRLLSSFAAAQSFSGPLQGGWTLSAQGAGDLYELQITETAGELGGAWRDLKRGRDPDGSGLLRLVRRTPTGLSLGFAPPGRAPVAVVLKADLTGELTQGDQRLAVTLRKIAP